MSNGGAARFGNVSLYSYLTLNASGTSSLLEFDGIYARSTVKIGVSAKAIIDSKGDFLYENTDTSSIVVEGAYFQMDGTRPQRLEVGGRDLGAVGASSRNFGYSQLIVGSTNQSSVVNLVDTLNNGNRGTGGTPEALYLYGQDGAGLSLYNGSRLALNGINCYAFVNGQMKRLNDLIPAGTNSVAFDGGFLVNDGGPRITNMTPSVALTPIVSSVTVSFDQPIDPASFTASDVSISGPSGAVAATGVTLVSNTTWMVSFQPQSTDGTYAVKVGPNIDELAGNIHGLDQNGDGLAGDGTNDVFMGTFVIDGTAPLLVSAYGLQFGNRIGVTFNEPLVATFATNPANYAIDGQAASNAVLQADRSLVALSVTPAAGSVFSLSVTGVTDLLGNVTNRLLDGTILPLQPMDIGISGDSREAGWSVPWSSTNFDIVAGGYAISSSSDSFHFLSEQRTGDFDVQVRLDSYKGTGGAQAGIMFRENLTSGSSHIFWAEEPSNGYYVWWRNLQGGGTSNAKTQSGSNLTNNWLRLKRVGNVFTMYQRTNGLNWALHYSVTNSLATKGYLGLATSRNSSDTSTNVLVRYRSYSDIIPAIVAQPQSQSVTSGVTVVFGASAYGLPTLAYQWFFNGLPLTGATSNLLSLPSVTVENVGDYRVVITNTFGAATSVVASLTVDGQGLGGFEGDVSPRPLGNNSVSVADWVQVGRFVAGLDAVMNSGEFQRADCAPRAIGGNGVLSIADWTQAGRYAAGLDPLVEAWGPTEPISQTLGARLSSLRNPMRVIQLIGPGTVWQGTEFVVPVTLTSQGNENALGFSLTFDPARLAFRGVTLDAGLAGAFVQINTQAVAKGEFGMALANPTEQSFTQGNVPIAMLRFAAIGTAGDAVVAFADAPVLREIVDPTATPLGASYASSLARIAGHPSFSAVERVIGNGLRFKLIGTPGQAFIIQTSTDLRQWAPLATNVFGSDPVTWVDSNGPGDKQRFYRMAPLP